MLKLADLVERVRSYHPSADVEIVSRAYDYSGRAHEGQKRKSGDPYFVHPASVAGIIAELRLDTASICAGLLHDVVEDTLRTLDDVEKEFGDEVAFLVDGVTKLLKINFTSKEDRQAENFRKMVVAMSRDIRVLLVKLCDRLDNMRTLDVMNPDLGWLARDPERRWSRTKFRHPTTGAPVVYTTNHLYDRVSQVNHIRIYYQPERGPEEVVRVAHRMFFPEELLTYAELAGLRLERRYGDFPGGPLDDASEQQVLVLRARCQTGGPVDRPCQPRSVSMTIEGASGTESATVKARAMESMQSCRRIRCSSTATGSFCATSSPTFFASRMPTAGSTGSSLRRRPAPAFRAA